MHKSIDDYNLAVVSVIKLITNNNAGCVARKLREQGYETKDYIPIPELEASLLQLHSVNRNLFYKIMIKCDWNKGNGNWTNDREIKSRIINAVKKHTGVKDNITDDNWWIITIDHLKNSIKS